MSDHNDTETLMRSCIEIADRARQKGNHPFGAMLVLDGQILLTAENRVNSDHDITSHAELNLVSMASRELDPAILSQAVLYTSTEPCAMCAGAIYWAGIPTVVYGCSAEVLGDIAGAAFVIPCRDIFQYGTRQVNVIGPILPEKAAAVHAGFWD